MGLHLLHWSILCLSVLVEAARGVPRPPVYEAIQEWERWKATHEKSYGSNLEELEKHIVWHSNRAFVKQHNVNAEMGVYSYQVKLNHLGDLVRW